MEEAPIDPQLPIIDPHHHLWDFTGSRYLLNEFLDDIHGGHSIVQTVFVECLSGYRVDGPAEMRPVGETEFVQRAAATGASSHGVANGVVGFADLTLGDAVEPVLAAHIEAGRGRFKGVRHASGWDPSPAVADAHSNPPKSLLEQEGFRQGYRCLRRFDLSFDACVYHTQLKEVAALARAFPDTIIILDHAGTPLGIGPYAARRKQVFEEWAEGMAALADCANVNVKLGGLGMDFCGLSAGKREITTTSSQLAEATAPYFHYCIEQFGPQRCMFESNFPVDKVTSSYTVLWNSFKRLSAGFSAGERSSLFHDTAARVYRLERAGA